MSEQIQGPHQGMNIATKGTEASEADFAMIMVHGRGASAESIVQLSDELQFPEVHYAAPQASGFTWYPHSFLAPTEMNEPGLSSGLQAIEQLRLSLINAGIKDDHIFLLGFSQGACLALEYSTRNGRRFAGIFGLSGGLIGPAVDSSNYSGSFNSTPVFLGCSDIDPHIPKERVNETETVMTSMNADVTKILYTNMGHFVNEDEISRVRAIMKQAMSG